MNDFFDEIEREEQSIALRTELLRRQKAQQEILATKQRRLQLAKTAVQEAEVKLKQEEEQTERIFEEIRQQRRVSDMAFQWLPSFWPSCCTIERQLGNMT